MSIVNDRQFYHFSNRQAGRIVCFVGGYIDCVGYTLLFSLFAASITGNIIKFSKSASENIFEIGFVVVTIAFGIGGVLAKILAVYLKTFQHVQDQHITIIFFVLEATLIFFTMLVSSYYRNAITEANSVNTPVVFCMGILLAIPMGFQNFSAGLAWKGFPNTTGMTAQIAQAFAALSHAILLQTSIHFKPEFGLTYYECTALSNAANQTLSASEQYQEVTAAKIALLNQKLVAAMDEVDKQWGFLLSFILGAILGALTADTISFWSLFLGIFLLIFLTVEAYWELKHVMNPIINLKEHDLQLNKMYRTSGKKSGSESDRQKASNSFDSSNNITSANVANVTPERLSVRKRNASGSSNSGSGQDYSSSTGNAIGNSSRQRGSNSFDASTINADRTVSSNRSRANTFPRQFHTKSYEANKEVNNYNEQQDFVVHENDDFRFDADLGTYEEDLNDAIYPFDPIPNYRTSDNTVGLASENIDATNEFTYEDNGLTVDNEDSGFYDDDVFGVANYNSIPAESRRLLSIILQSLRSVERASLVQALLKYPTTPSNSGFNLKGFPDLTSNTSRNNFNDSNAVALQPLVHNDSNSTPKANIDSVGASRSGTPEIIRPFATLPSFGSRSRVTTPDIVSQLESTGMTPAMASVVTKSRNVLIKYDSVDYDTNP